MLPLAALITVIRLVMLNMLAWQYRENECPTIHWSPSKNKHRTQNKSVLVCSESEPNQILRNAADLDPRPVQEKDVCLDPNWTAQLLQMTVLRVKSWEPISGMILNLTWLQPKFAATGKTTWIANEKQGQKPCKEGKRTASTGWASIFCSKIFFEQSATENN